MQCYNLTKLGLVSATASLGLFMSVGSASATTFSLTVNGTDAIYLAGRTDVTIPNLGSSNPSFPLLRHGFVAGDFLKETFPQSIAASNGQEFSFFASGCVNYYNGLGCQNNTNGFGPDGNGLSGSNTNSLGGISAFKGPQGPLVGVFLNNSIPLNGAPAALDFTPGGIGSAFASLAPSLGQVFFIGDGLTGTGSGAIQKFLAPTGATRLFLGIADGFGFAGGPGAYDDNDGKFQVRVTVTDPTTVPEPATITGLLLMGGLFGLSRRRQSVKA